MTQRHCVYGGGRLMSIYARCPVSHAESRTEAAEAYCIFNFLCWEIPRYDCRGNRHGMTLGWGDFLLPTSRFLRRMSSLYSDL